VVVCVVICEEHLMQLVILELFVFQWTIVRSQDLCFALSVGDGCVYCGIGVGSIYPGGVDCI